MSKEWNLVHSLGAEAKWTDGFRAEFQYRDLGIEAGTKGAFTAHLVKAKPGLEDADIHEWHVHDCTFQLVLVLEGWARFEYEGHDGECVIRKGDCMLQPAGLKHRELSCSDDFECLEVISPADFGTRDVEAPAAAT